MAVTLTRPKTIRFDKKRARSKPALALVYDLGGFTKFANRPDAAQWIPPFLNHVSQAMQTVIYGGVPYWLDGDDTEYYRLPKPTHQKFLGDGALYIWTGTHNEPLSQIFINALCSRLRDLRSNFRRVTRAVREKIQIPDFPREIRFGLAAGDVYELSRRDARQREYVGVCINLASRLQKYCNGIGIAAARIQMSPLTRRAESFVRVIATNIAGFPSEYVIVDESEYRALNRSVRGKFFKPVA